MCAVYSGNRYFLIFNRLTKCIQCFSGKLCQLIKKQNTIMGKRNLSRHCIYSAPD